MAIFMKSSTALHVLFFLRTLRFNEEFFTLYSFFIKALHVLFIFMTGSSFWMYFYETFSVIFVKIHTHTLSTKTPQTSPNFALATGQTIKKCNRKSSRIHPDWTVPLVRTGWLHFSDKSPSRKPCFQTISNIVVKIYKNNNWEENTITQHNKNDVVLVCQVIRLCWYDPESYPLVGLCEGYPLSISSLRHWQTFNSWQTQNYITHFSFIVKNISTKRNLNLFGEVDWCWLIIGKVWSRVMMGHAGQSTMGVVNTMVTLGGSQAWRPEKVTLRAWASGLHKALVHLHLSLPRRFWGCSRLSSTSSTVPTHQGIGHPSTSMDHRLSWDFWGWISVLDGSHWYPQKCAAC